MPGSLQPTYIRTQMWVPPTFPLLTQATCLRLCPAATQSCPSLPPPAQALPPCHALPYPCPHLKASSPHNPAALSSTPPHSPSGGPESSARPRKCHARDFESQQCSLRAQWHDHPGCARRTASHCSPCPRYRGTRAGGSERPSGAGQVTRSPTLTSEEGSKYLRGLVIGVCVQEDGQAMEVVFAPKHRPWGEGITGGKEEAYACSAGGVAGSPH